MDDLSNIGAIEDTFVLELKHPHTGKVLEGNDGPMTITIYGADSEQYKAWERDVANEGIRRQAKAQAKGKTPTMTIEEIEERGNKMLASMIKEWTIILEGKTPTCNEDTILGLFKDRPWIREQVDEAVHDRANFMKT